MQFAIFIPFDFEIWSMMVSISRVIRESARYVQRERLPVFYVICYS